MQHELKCYNCKRYLGTAYGTIIAEIPCGNSSCKAGNQIKIINGDNVADITHKFLTPPREPKTKKPITNEDAEALRPEVS